MSRSHESVTAYSFMKPALTKNTRALVERALRTMLRYPEAYNQAVFVESTSCGMVACIAGHLVLAAGAEPRSFCSHAEWLRSILGDDAEVLLFNDHCAGWPGQFRGPFLRAKRPATKARIAVDRVRHWLRTGK